MYPFEDRSNTDIWEKRTILGKRFPFGSRSVMGGFEEVLLRQATLSENVWSAARLQGKVLDERESAQMYSAFGWSTRLLAMMSCARALPYKRADR